MTRSYFKAIIWDNSNYVQEQRRSKQLVPPLNSSEPLAKRRLLCVEGGGGRGGGRKWEAGGGEVEEAELLTRDTEGLPRAELLQKAELSVPGATPEARLWWVLGRGRGGSFSTVLRGRLRSAHRLGRALPSRPSPHFFSLPSLPSLGVSILRLSHARTPALPPNHLTID